MANEPLACPSCRFESPAGSRFCAGCGARLALTCSGCGTEQPLGFRFCPQCGSGLGPGAPTTPSGPSKEDVFRVQDAKVRAYTPPHLAERILTTRGALEGERKAVTVLFADVAGFTALASRLSPEDLHDVMDGCFERLSRAVHQYEGTINQFTGDGVMALFGAPIAHEDHAERATHAALAIQDAIGEYGAALRRDRALDFEMRIGLNSGTVVVGRIGDNLRMDYTAQGDTVNLAARLEQACLPGKVLVSETTRRLAEGAFAFSAVPPLALKGKQETVPAYLVEGRRERRARPELQAEHGLTPLTGRERELVQLRQAFERAREGHGQVVGIMGEAGVGKSRLLYELRREVEAAGALYLEGGCISYGQTIPFHPIIEMLRRGLGIEEGERDDAIRTKVEERIRALDADDRHLPFLLNLLGVDSDSPAVKTVAAEAKRRYTFEALRALTMAGSARRPIVFAVEDLHWSDQPSQDFLRYLAEHSTRSRVLLMATYRPGYVPPWSDKSYASQIALTPLSESESERIVTAVLGVTSLPEEVRRLVLQKAEGNPFYLEEVTRSFVEEGILVRTDDRYALTRQVTAQDVPDTVQGVVMARIDRLADERKRTIQTAAVVGREFALRLLRQISDIQERLDESLSDLKALEFIYEKALYPDLEYVFKHALVQDVAYGSLLRPRRRLLHELVARAIEELYADRLEERVADLAHHFRHGEVWAKAFEYARRAGDRARAIFANREAIHHYTEALEAAERMTPRPGAAELMSIHEARGMVWHLLTNYDSAVSDFEAMQLAARQLGDRVKEGEALCNQASSHWWRFSEAHKGLVEKCAREAAVIAEETEDERILARVLFNLGMVDQKAGLLREADQKFVRSVEICRRRALKGPLVTNLTWLGAHANWRGELTESLPYLEEAERLAHDIHEGFYELVAACFRINALAGLGHWDQAFRMLEGVLQRGRDRENKYAVARGINTLGWFHNELGDFRGATELNREGIELGLAAKITNNEIYARINLAEAHLGLSELGAARTLLEDAAERLRTGFFDSHLWKWTIRVNLGLARLWLLEGQLDKSSSHLDEGLRVAGRTEAGKYLAVGRQMQGELHLTAGRTAEAIAALQEALELARSVACPRVTWETGSALGRALAQSRREDEARAAYELAAGSLHATVPRIPRPTLRDALLASEQVSRLREEAGRLGIVSP